MDRCKVRNTVMILCKAGEKLHRCIIIAYESVSSRLGRAYVIKTQFRLRVPDELTLLFAVIISVPINILNIKQFSIECVECRKTKTKVITLANHEGQRQPSEPIKT